MSTEDVGDPIVDALIELASAIDAKAHRDEVEPWLEVLPLCVAAEDAMAVLLRRAVNGARDAGASWAAIGRTLGVTRQAAMRRFGSPPAR